ncbi:MAG: 1-acyl-sn-glycerol-3-phosphate acyltransferase, partial [bacterium]|nr:1-acyl-sn-glycerol-3-phosphate acyltransferase [bacterium]
MHVPTPIAYAFLRAFVRLLLWIFFRSVTVDHGERLPKTGPVIIVGNHQNGLVDPGLFLAFLPRAAQFLGKHTLWQTWILRPFLALAGAIPVYRPQDGAESAKNDVMFAKCVDALRDGRCIAIFPEGVSNDAPSLRPLKTGAARIALRAAATCAPTTVSVVPVGLTFDAKTRFRSEALLTVGEPITITATADDTTTSGAVRALTERIRRSLEAV